MDNFDFFDADTTAAPASGAEEDATSHAKEKDQPGKELSSVDTVKVSAQASAEPVGGACDDDIFSFDSAPAPPPRTTHSHAVDSAEHDGIVVVSEEQQRRAATRGRTPQLPRPPIREPATPPQVISSAVPAGSQNSTISRALKAPAIPDAEASARVKSTIRDSVAARRTLQRQVDGMTSSNALVETAEGICKDQRTLRRKMVVLKLESAFALLDMLLFRSPVGIGAVEAEAQRVLSSAPQNSVNADSPSEASLNATGATGAGGPVVVPPVAASRGMAVD